MLPCDTARELRPVEPGDLWALWRLVNDPAVRRAALISSNPIPREEHRAWFRDKLASPKTRIWVLNFHGLILGVVRYDLTDPDTAEISIHVASAFRRRGLGLRMLVETRQRARDELGADRLRAIIRQENRPSIQTFTKAGFAGIDAKPVHNHPCYVYEQTVAARVGR